MEPVNPDQHRKSHLKWVNRMRKICMQFACRHHGPPRLKATRHVCGSLPHLLSILKANPQSLIHADECRGGGRHQRDVVGGCATSSLRKQIVPEAAEFINYLTSTETQVWAYDAVDLLPTTTAFREVIRRLAIRRGFADQPASVSHGRPPLCRSILP